MTPAAPHGNLGGGIWAGVWGLGVLLRAGHFDRLPSPTLIPQPPYPSPYTLPPGNRQPATAPGFTLLELIVVLTLLAIISAAVVPLYLNSTESLREERALRDLYATLKFAQERAIFETTEYRVYLDDERGAYWLTRMTGYHDEQKIFARVDEPYAERTVLPEGVTMRKPKARRDEKVKASYIAFYPSGACDAASITLERKDGRTLAVNTKGKLGQYTVRESR